MKQRSNDQAGCKRTMQGSLGPAYGRFGTRRIIENRPIAEDVHLGKPFAMRNNALQDVTATRRPSLAAI